MMIDYNKLDLNTLNDLLIYHTSTYITLMEEEGQCKKSNQCRETISDIQAAIEAKKNVDIDSIATGGDIQQDSLKCK